MKHFFLSILLSILFISCKSEKEETTKIDYTNVEIKTLLEDSISVRAIEIMGEDLAFASNNGKYGIYNSKPGEWNINVKYFDSIIPEYRAVASTSQDFFMLSVGNPALLYKTGDAGMELVYREDHEKVFYDAMSFWNDNDGIAMGDPVENCLSIIITNDGGNTWNKLPCDILPETEEGEAAFAASNSNIALKGDKVWILSGGMKSRIYYSEDKGKSWEVYNTPLMQGTATSGGYSMDFYDENNGVIVGGDYTIEEDNSANKAITKDGGKTWELIGENSGPGYLSTVRYIPNATKNDFIAAGPEGIFYTSNAGSDWIKISDMQFHSIRFLNDSIAFAAGNGKISKLKFKK